MTKHQGKTIALALFIIVTVWVLEYIGNQLGAWTTEHSVVSGYGFSLFITGMCAVIGAFSVAYDDTEED